MSFYISLSGLKGAQADLTTVSNNVANVGSTGFKKSKTEFGDIFVGQSDGKGQGVRTLGSSQQFTQGTLETTDKTLDLAITGEGFFTVKSPAPSNTVSYTRNGTLGMDKDRNVTDTTGSQLQVFRADANGNPVKLDGTAMTTPDSTQLKGLSIPSVKMDDSVNPPVAFSPAVELSSISITTKGVVSATYADGTTSNLGVVAMANFPNTEGLRQTGDAHWVPTGNSGTASYGQGETGQYGSIRSGMLERSNVDITEELVGLIAAQRNFQANAKAIEAANSITTTINNLRS